MFRDGNGYDENEIGSFRAERSVGVGGWTPWLPTTWYGSICGNADVSYRSSYVDNGRRWQVWQSYHPGGFILGLLQSLVVWQFSARWEDAVAFIILILFLMFKPEGILGERRRMV